MVGVSGIVIHEKFSWEPTGHDLDGNQLFYYYYSDQTQHNALQGTDTISTVKIISTKKAQFAV